MARATMDGAIALMARNDITCASFVQPFFVSRLCISIQPFGVSYSGATYKYTVLDTSGHRSAAQGK